MADVGCDHGFLDIYLVQSGRSPSCVAMDVRKGPLEAASRHVREAGLGQYIETKLSDGLEQFEIGTAKTLVVAGMGGPLMCKILSDYPEKTESFRELILQPQSEIREFRVFLRNSGYRIVEERMILEDGKYYFPMKAVKAPCRESGNADKELQELYERYGRDLLENRHPLMQGYLQQQERIQTEILEHLAPVEGDGDRTRRRALEVKAELEAIQRALERIGRLS